MKPAWRRALKLGLEQRRAYLVGLATLLVVSALNVAVPWLLKLAFDGLQQGREARFVAGVAATLLGVAALRAIVRTLSRFAILGSSRRVAARLREQVFEHLQRLPVEWYDRTPTGDIVSRVINDLSHVQGLFGPVAMNLMNTAALYAMALVLLASLDWRLTLFSLAPYALLAATVKHYSRRMHRESTLAQESLSRISSHLNENLNGITVVKSYRREEAEIRRFDGLADEYYEAIRRFARSRSVLIPLMGLVGSSGMIVVLALGGRRVIDGSFSLGDFVAFTSALAMLAWPAIALGWVLNGLQRGSAALDRIEELLAEEPELEPPASRAPEPARPPIEFRSLSFGYTPAGPPVLHEVSFRLDEGSWLGIVGPTGSGKSTIVQLLTGLRRPAPGGLFVAGRDVTTLPPGTLRGAVAAVPQGAFLFSSSVRENIAYARPETAADAEVMRAIAEAGFEKDLPQLPEGLETVVGERGVTLSGGQRQRVTLARALLLRPQVLVLDDSLSAVDSQTEQEILEALRTLRRERQAAAVIVSHRLSAVVECDEILVLDAGRVIERGTHAELLALGGLYAATWREQELSRELAEVD